MQTEVVRGLVAGAVFTFWSGGYALAQGDGSVTLTYVSPSVLSVHEPATIEVVVKNDRTDTVALELGKNDVGNLQLTLRPPTGPIVAVDPRRPLPGILEEGFTNRPTWLQSSERRTYYMFLNEWFGSLDVEGQYQLEINFIGPVTTESGDDIAVARQASVVFTVGPLDLLELRGTCERLAQRARSSADAQEALRAAKALSYVRHPIAVEYLEWLIERGKVVESLAVEDWAIHALQRMAIPEARDALMRARLNTRPVTMKLVDAALLEMDTRPR
jgi:hypothetical protein